MGCTFCASGKLGLVRNLTAGEITDQILQAEKITGEKINHVVVMGTGEPFDNYDGLAEFIRRINDKDGLDFDCFRAVVGNTFDAHRLSKFARARGVDMTGSLFDACFRDGRELSGAAARNSAHFRELFLAQAADGAHPIFGDIFPGRAGSDAVVRIAGFGVIDITAGALVLIHDAILLYP